VPRRSSFAFAQSDGADDAEYSGSLGEQHVPKEHHSLLRQHPETRGSLLEATFGETVSRSDGGNGEGSSKRIPSGGSLYDIYSQAVSPLGRSFGTSYGTVASSRMTETARKRAAQLHKEQQLTEVYDGPDKCDRVLVKEIQHEDGSKETVVIGQSTVPQTIFNSVNVLIGIGLLSLPLGLKYSGWLIGTPFLIFSAVTTSYTAKILAKCMDADPTLVTYADLAYISFGSQARFITSLLFCFELIGTCVALVVLFADSLDALIPGSGVIQWKMLCGIILIPLNFVPLRLLSVSSILGILSCTSSKFHTT
jgi:vesicular inhibitory amino acid transporter